MEEINLNFSFKARYCKLGDLSPDNPRMCFVFHGYGHLAPYFIRKFESLAAKSICVIAPEGLSKFYLEPFDDSGKRKSNRVGATWMTRENRETDIENYTNYIQAIYEKEVTPNTVVDVIGFSQGAATSSRWLINSKPKFDRFIIWAGIFPPDMNFLEAKTVFNNKKVIAIYGSDDPYVTPERIQEMNDLSAKVNVIPERISFHGKHEIKDEILTSLF